MQDTIVHRGPVQYRIAISSVAGALTGQTDKDGWLAFAAYKLRLAGVGKFFPAGPSQHWNEE